MGNHDLNRDAAVSRWLALAPGFFGVEAAADYSVVTDDVAIHVVPTQWEEQPYRWSGPQREHLTDGQERFLEVKRFEATPTTLTMETVRLGERIGWTPVPDAGRPYVQGRPTDRAFTWHRGLPS